MEIEKLINNNKNAICRVCMQSGESNLYPIFNEISCDNTITIAEILTECTKYPVSQNDLLPVQVCNTCMEAARSAHQFKRQTEDAYRRLKALYDKQWVPKKENDSSYGDVGVRVLSTDKNTQTDEKSPDFKCESCLKELFIENDLKEHTTEHQNEDNECNSRVLRNRLFTGNPNKAISEYICNICSKEFGDKNHLRRHMLQNHLVSPKKPNAQICKEYRERQKLTKTPKICPRSGTKSNAQKCKEYRERQKIKEDANSRIKATLEEPEIENEEDDDSDTNANPFASDQEDYNIKDEDVKQFIETITDPEILIKDDLNDIIDEYSYDDIDESIMEPEAILLESEDDEVELVNNSDYESQCYQQKHNESPESYSDAHKYQQNFSNNMFRCMVCHMEFKLRRILVRHMLTHNDERPFSCHMCLKTFKRKDNLQKHLREVHHKNFSCDLCFEKFGTYKRLLRHNQTNHHTRTY